jgi:hypothetical protein
MARAKQRSLAVSHPFKMFRGAVFAALLDDLCFLRRDGRATPGVTHVSGLDPEGYGGPSWTRTTDLTLIRGALSPPELRAHATFFSIGTAPESVNQNTRVRHRAAASVSSRPPGCADNLSAPPTASVDLRRRLRSAPDTNGSLPAP